jgi:hypothetical protein
VNLWVFTNVSEEMLPPFSRLKGSSLHGVTNQKATNCLLDFFTNDLLRCRSYSIRLARYGLRAPRKTGNTAVGKTVCALHDRS